MALSPSLGDDTPHTCENPFEFHPSLRLPQPPYALNLASPRCQAPATSRDPSRAAKSACTKHTEAFGLNSREFSDRKMGVRSMFLLFSDGVRMRLPFHQAFAFFRGFLHEASLRLPSRNRWQRLGRIPRTSPAQKPLSLGSAKQKPSRELGISLDRSTLHSSGRVGPRSEYVPGQ